jgi:hypothetical protein
MTADQPLVAGTRRLDFTLCMVAVATLHAAVLASLGSLPTFAGTPHAQRSSPPQRMSVVSLGSSASAPPETADTGKASMALAAGPHAAAKLGGSSDAAASWHGVLPAAANTESLSRVNPASAAIDTSAGITSAGNNDDVYLPRSALTKPARPTAPIEIAYPEGTPVGDYRAVLLLFVDETGRVRRMRVRDAGLPYGLERAASEAFLGATFEPGEHDGQAVKSIYTVEISFVATSQPGPVTRGSP